MNKKKGVTLVEIVVVIVLLSIFVGILFSFLKLNTTYFNNTSNKIDVKNETINSFDIVNEIMQNAENITILDQKPETFKSQKSYIYEEDNNIYYKDVNSANSYEISKITDAEIEFTDSDDMILTTITSTVADTSFKVSEKIWMKKNTTAIINKTTNGIGHCISFEYDILPPIISENIDTDIAENNLFGSESYWLSTDESLSQYNIQGTYYINFEDFFKTIGNEVSYQVENTSSNIYDYEDDINNEINNGNYVFTFTDKKNVGENFNVDKLGEVIMDDEGKNLVINTRGNDIYFLADRWYMKNSQIEVRGGGHLYLYSFGHEIDSDATPFDITLDNLDKYDKYIIDKGDDIRPSECGDITFVTYSYTKSKLKITNDVIRDYGTYYAWFYLPNGGIEFDIDTKDENKNDLILEGGIICHEQDFDVRNGSFLPNDTNQKYVKWTGDDSKVIGNLQ